MASGLINPYKNNGQASYGPIQSRNRSASPLQSGPYQGNLQTDFSDVGRIQGGDTFNQLKRLEAMPGRNDRDVRGAADAHYQLTHVNEGTNGAEQLALFNMYQGRIKQKNALAEQIGGNEEQKKNSISSIYGNASQALGQGLKSTRENFNRRGLLYSGMRESGEASVRGGVGAKLAGDVSGTNREYANSLEKAKQAYASIGMASAQENMNLANQAFQTVNQNNIARLQAYQQFAGGLGQAAGYAYGSYGSKGAQPGAPQSQGGGLVSGNGVYGVDSNFDSSRMGLV